MITLRRHHTFEDRTGVSEFECFAVRFSQTTGGAAIVEAEIQLPVGGLLNGPRFATLSVDGTDYATGKIDGFPSGLAGDIITVSFQCWHPDYSVKVDELFEGITISEHLEDKARKRRADGYMPNDVYINPRTGLPSLVRIGGEGPVSHVLSGEGGAGEWDIFSCRFSVTGTPIKQLDVSITAAWTEIACEVIDYGSVVGDDDSLTPKEYEQVIASIQTGGSGYALITAQARPIYGQSSLPVFITTRRPHTNPMTGLKVGKRVVQLMGQKYQTPEISIATSVEQQRNETIIFTVTAPISDAFAPRIESEDITLTDPQRTISGTFYSYRTIVMPGQVGNWFFKTPITEDSMRHSKEIDLIMSNVRGMAAKRILEAAHCAHVECEVTAECARALTLRDRVTVSDVRLPGGAVTGQVTSIEWTDGAEGLGTIGVRIPAGESASTSIPSPIPEITGTVTPSPKVQALRAHHAAYFVRSTTITGMLDEQMAKIEEINLQNNSTKPTSDLALRASEAIRRVTDYLPKPSITIDFIELGSGPDDALDTELRATQQINVAKGI